MKLAHVQQKVTETFGPHSVIQRIRKDGGYVYVVRLLGTIIGEDKYAHAAYMNAMENYEQHMDEAMNKTVCSHPGCFVSVAVLVTETAWCNEHKPNAVATDETCGVCHRPDCSGDTDEVCPTGPIDAVGRSYGLMAGRNVVVDGKLLFHVAMPSVYIGEQIEEVHLESLAAHIVRLLNANPYTGN